MSVEVPSAYAGFTLHELDFDRHSRLVDPSQVDAIRAAVTDRDLSDLLVLAHGWNNDKADAWDLYAQLLTSLAAAAGDRLDGRALEVVLVFWPSKRFAERDLIPGGAASVETDVPEHVLHEDLEHLRGFFDPDDADAIIDELEALVPRLDGEAAARDAFADGVRRLLDPELDDPEVLDEMPPALRTAPGDELLRELAVPRPEEAAAGGPGGPGGPGGVGGPGGAGGGAASEGGIAASEGGIAASEGGIAAVGGPGPSAGGDEGGAAFVGRAVSGVRSGARNALNLVTYYTMKARAGDVGRSGLAPVLAELRDAAPDLKLHLAGHSFGGRLVAAAALGPEGGRTVEVDNLALLQAAFSHHGFATDHVPGEHGYFRDVVADRRVRGTMLITHTRNDRATTWAYPVASRAARQRAASFGGPDDVYGAIGTNGALATPGATAGSLLSSDATYELTPGSIHNLEASTFVSSHSAVTGPEIAHALVSAIAST